MDSSSDENAHITEVSDTDYEPLPRQSEPYPPRRGQRVLATVYDAVAGRVTYDKVLRDEDLERNQLPTGVSQQRQQQRPSRDYLKLAPEDVLFRRKDAPERYEEHDIYRAHERDLIITIPNAGGGDGGVGRGGGSNSNSSRIVGRVLPESDLLQAVHSYSSQFYGALNRQDAQQRLPAPPPPTVKGQRQQRRNVDECSMDETALLAFGILLEEAAREVLGRRGHLVFTEPAADEDGEQEEEEPSHHHHRRHRGGSRRRGGDGAEELELYQGSGVVVIGHQGGLVGSSAQRSGPKRRRLAKTEDEMSE